MKTNKELRALARSQLKGDWLTAVLVVLVYGVIFSASSAVVIGSLILGGPLTLGLVCFFLKKARGESAALDNLFDGFKSFVPGLKLFLLQFVYVFLWSLLFFIPGIIKAFSYSMSFYILHDNPNISAAEAITQSRQMMNGNKFKLFTLYLSFIGWCFLCLLTFGIGYLWLIPYMNLSIANFYEDLKQRPGQS